MMSLLQENEHDEHEDRHDDVGHPRNSRQGQGVQPVKDRRSNEDAGRFH